MVYPRIAVTFNLVNYPINWIYDAQTSWYYPMKLKNKSGFTLIELIVVIVLVSIVSKVIITKWPKAVNLNAQAYQLANEINYTQSLAFSQGKRYRLNLTSTGYSITDINGNAVPDPVTHTNSTSFPSGVTASWSNLPNALIAFDSNGNPYTNSAATTLLAATAVITLTQGGVGKTISISQQTGRVIVQ
jgi:prepilin-type N-terminal cleavage/methylation domain-containing protein